MQGATMRHNAAHNLSVQTAFLTALFSSMDNPEIYKYLVDLKTGEPLSKSKGKSGGEVPAAEGLSLWFHALKALEKN